MKALLLALGCALLAAAAFAQQKPGQPALGSSIDGLWYLRPLIAADSATGLLPTLKISVSTHSFSGNTGCNTMEGKLERTDSSLRFTEPIAMTRRYCSGYDEAAFLRSLKKANRYQLRNGELILYVDGTELSRWTRRPVKPTLNRRA